MFKVDSNSAWSKHGLPTCQYYYQKGMLSLLERPWATCSCHISLAWSKIPRVLSENLASGSCYILWNLGVNRSTITHSTEVSRKQGKVLTIIDEFPWCSWELVKFYWSSDLRFPHSLSRLFCCPGCLFYNQSCIYPF